MSRSMAIKNVIIVTKNTPKTLIDTNLAFSYIKKQIFINKFCFTFLWRFTINCVRC